MKKITLSLFICLLSSVVFSQKLSMYLGDKQYDQFNYVKAIEYYEHSLKKDSTNVNVYRKLGQSYYKMHKYESAINYFEMLMKHPDRKDEDLVLYGEITKEMGDYVRSETLLRKYRLRHPLNTEVPSLLRDLEALNNANLPSLICKVDSMSINSKFSDFGPVIYRDKLVFSSGRKNQESQNEIYGWDGQYFLELFQYTRGGILGEDIKRFAKSIGTKYHEAALCFSNDFKTMFFTRSNYNKGKLKRDKNGVNNLKIFIAEERSGRWDVVGEFPFNSNEFSVGHPSLSADGKILYFVSDMPGGYGGTDIYYSILKNGQWTKPKNLGRKINSHQNEMFPHIKNKFLFFASNGHSGLGGLDLYMVKDISKNEEPVHLGRPLNSAQDDFALIISDKGGKGYFSSNRRGGLGEDDIYAFEISKENEIEFELRDYETKQLLKADEVLCNGVLDANLDFDADKSIYKKTVIREQKNTIHFVKKGFEVLDTTLLSAVWDAKKKHSFYMTPIPVELEEIAENLVKENAVIIPPIYFDFDKSDITSDAYEIVTRAYNALEKDVELKLIISANTDIRGSQLYNERLANRRAKSTFAELMKMGIAKDRIVIKTYGERKPLDQSDNQVLKIWHKNNRRVDFEFKK